MKSDDNRESRRWRDRLESVRNQRRRRAMSCEPWCYRSIRTKLTEGTAPRRICRAPTRRGHVGCHDVSCSHRTVVGKCARKNQADSGKITGAGGILPGCAIPLCQIEIFSCGSQMPVPISQMWTVATYLLK